MDVLATWLPEHLCARVCVCVRARVFLCWFVLVCARAFVSVSVCVCACVYVGVSVCEMQHTNVCLRFCFVCVLSP